MRAELHFTFESAQPQQRPVVVLQYTPCSPCQSLVSCALVGSFERCSGGFHKNLPGEVFDFAGMPL